MTKNININLRVHRKKHGLNWYRINRNLHRDIGYLCIGFTLVFAISGIAVNHIRDWNPNYSIVKKTAIEPKLIHIDNEDEIIDLMLTSFKIINSVKANYWASEHEFKVFLTDGSNLNANLTNGEIELELITERKLLKNINSLHLNEAKAAWVIFSDAYAIMLIFLAISALFMVKGKHSPWGRKGGLVLLGFAIPLFFMFLS